MNEERKRILDLLAAGKVSVAEADELLAALGATAPAERKVPKYLRVQVQSNDPEKGEETVNIRVPFQLLRSGVKLAALIPSGVHDKVNSALHDQGLNIDLSKIKPENLEEVVNHLADLSVDVDSKHEKVRVFCE